MNTFCNVSFLFLCCIVASTNHVVAVLYGVPDDSILCPGQPTENYCDCTGDCTEKPEWCQCAQAQECCSSFVSDDDGVPDDSILCPGQPTENYCDCTGDCTEQPEWCQCAEAQECCEQNSFNFFSKNDGAPNDNILCPGQPIENYCDCTGDCTEQPQWCQCAEAQECCAKISSSTSVFGLGKLMTSTKAPKDFLLPIGLAIGAFLTCLILKIRSSVCRNKEKKPKTSLSETAAYAVKPATSDGADEEETVASSSTILDE